MKAAVAVPPIRDFYFTPTRASALGATALLKILRRYGIKAELFNFPLEAKKNLRLALPDELGYLKPHILPHETGPVSFFTGYRLFGPPAPLCAERINETGAGILFISCFAWAYADDCIELASEVKRLNPGIITAAGGAGITVNPEYFRSAGCIDYVLPGAAEAVLPGFLEDECGLVQSGGLRTVSEHVPDFIWAETGVSESRKMRFISAMLTRGCPKNCRFCANHIVHGREFRKALPNQIMKGLEEIPADLNLHINLEDDNLLLDRDFLFSSIEIMKERFPRSTFSAENGLDYTLLDLETLRRLIEAGFKSFNLSMASSSPKLLREQNRRSDTERLRLVIETAAGAGIPTVTYFICGLEKDTPASVLGNILSLHELPTLTGISLFYPVPGLPGFPPEVMSGHKPRLCAGSSAYPWTGSLTTGQLVTAFRLSRLSNLIKTRQNKIMFTDSRGAGSDVNAAVISKTFRTGRLHTFAGGRIAAVPVQDEELVSAFLASASLD